LGKGEFGQEKRCGYLAAAKYFSCMEIEVYSSETKF
jgi:hypothetical protein